jgi:ribonuclease E
MTSESKILTVSYGTFSCTLEGFDDPFNAMKAIAEYFRDLAADDRYFGAEPPQPDAAMLHRIAEREVSRLVDTRVRDNSVYLRPKADPAAPMPAGLPSAGSEAVSPTGQPRSLQDQSADTSAMMLDDAADEADQAVVEPSLHDAIPDGVAARLARIRQSVTPPSITAPLPEELLQEFGDETGMNVALAEDFSEDLAEDAEDLPELESASDLADLSALVAEAEDDAAATAGSDALLADLAEMEPDDQTAAADLAEADDDAETDDASAVSDALNDPDDAEALPLPEAILADSLPEDEPDMPDSLVEALADDPTPELLAGSTFEPDETSDTLATPSDDDPQATAAKGGGRSKRVSSRVVRIHPDDDEDEDIDAAADQPDPNATRILSGSGEDAEVARLLRQADDVMADAENRRRLESIAHLKAAVVATEADRATSGEGKSSATAKLDPYRDDLAHVVQPDAEPSPEARQPRKNVSVRPQEPRPGTMRSGTANPPPLVLVSEQRIDRVSPAPAGPHHREGQPMVALRTGRLTGAIGAGATAGIPMQPHKKLVLDRASNGNAAEIDDEDDIDEDLTEMDEAGLASFAERVGVKSMAEMLEAAAAYATCIENRNQFTRPQLMRRLMASAGGRPISREDGLRSFGTLLRTGRIEKISRGQYVLAESSPYLAEARRFS